MLCQTSCSYFFFNDTATTEIYTLSLHDALPISEAGASSITQEEQGKDLGRHMPDLWPWLQEDADPDENDFDQSTTDRSEEHTSELQSRSDLVCRLLLEKKKILTDAQSIKHPLTI